MGGHIGENKLVITAGDKTFHFDLPKDVKNNLKYKIDSIIKHYEFLADHKLKNEIRQLFSRHKHGNNIQEYRKQ